MKRLARIVVSLSALLLSAAGGAGAASLGAAKPLALSGERAAIAPAWKGSSASLTARDARSALKTARTAMQSGRLAEALKGYESVLASPASAQDSRAEALYWAGMLRLSPEPSLRDIDRARAYFGELKVFHGGSGRQDEAGIILALTEELADVHKTAESARSERAAADKAITSCLDEKQQAGEALKAALAENASLKEADAAHRAELSGLRDEIKRKDEALKKVKEVVVGWKTPR